MAKIVQSSQITWRLGIQAPSARVSATAGIYRDSALALLPRINIKSGTKNGDRSRLQGSRNIKDGCRQDTGTQKPDLVEPESKSKLLKADSQANQEMMSKRDEEHMMVPTQPTFKEQGQVAMDFYTRTKTIYENHG